eukprot:jgi/Bigna1/80012/fgenesh1_pg.67_\
MSDVKDILGLTHKGGQPTPKATTKKQTAKNNPLTKGLAREVRNLLDDNNRVPGLVQAQTQFKAKRSRKISWKLERIRSSARRTITGKEKDDLDIFHWVKIHNMPDYRFAKWNKELKMLKYTDVEYENHLKDPKWSRAETDKLFDLCRRFDLRFLVIHDRYNPILNNLEVPYIPKSTHEGYPFAAAAAATGGWGVNRVKGYRTIEELKSRYYDCQKLLLKARKVGEGVSEKELQAQHPMFQHNYDGEHEKTRREQMELLFRRTSQQEKEITAKVAETREIDKKMRRVKKQLDALKKNPRAALGMIQRAARVKAAAAAGGSGVAPSSGRRGRRKKKKNVVVSSNYYLDANAPRAKIPNECHPEANMLPVLTSGSVSLSSSRPTIAPFLKSGRVYKQLETELIELGFNYAAPRPFKAPSYKVTKMYDELRRNLVRLINLNKHVMEREKERDRLRSALRAQNKSTHVGGGGTHKVKRELSTGGGASTSSSSKSKRQRKS